jgi:hypothetical protein
MSEWVALGGLPPGANRRPALRNALYGRQLHAYTELTRLVEQHRRPMLTHRQSQHTRGATLWEGLSLHRTAGGLLPQGLAVALLQQCARTA